MLRKRIIDLSYKHGLSHIGSCLTSLPLIENIYKVKKPNEPFILGNSHSALALYVVLEYNGFGNAEELWKKHGTHANRDMKHGIWVSGGSLGQAETVAVGLALANRKRNCYLLTSDGALAEGSIWEALRIASEQRLENLRITVNANSYGAYGKIDVDWLDLRLQYFYPTLVIKTNMFKYPHFLQGIGGHYKILNKEEYKELIK